MKVALLQMNSAHDPSENMAFIREHARVASDAGCDSLYLPECFYSMSNGLVPSEFLVEGKNEHYQAIQSIAKDFGLNLIGGSAATQLGDKVINRAFNFNKEGVELPHYDKMHLFSCDIKKEGERKAIDEADIYTPGSEPTLLEVDGVKIGLGICFDVRYPQMSYDYIKAGAQILTFSAAFTVPTGRAHWHTLLRARAIEGQCFVIACAQVGKHNERIITYGHSLIIDPWGEILVDAGEEPGLHIAELNLNRIEEVRKSVMVFK